MATLEEKIDALTITLDVYHQNVKSVETRLSRIEEALWEIKINHTDAVRNVQQMRDTIMPLLDEVKPAVDSLMNSPMLKMLGV